jgi:hypothetical protein
MPSIIQVGTGLMLYESGCCAVCWLPPYGGAADDTHAQRHPGAHRLKAILVFVSVHACIYVLDHAPCVLGVAALPAFSSHRQF